MEKLKSVDSDAEKIKPVILIVTEGSQTEPKYFEHYRNRQTNIDIRGRQPHQRGGETDYLSLIRKAMRYQNKKSDFRIRGRLLHGQLQTAM